MMKKLFFLVCISFSVLTTAQSRYQLLIEGTPEEAVMNPAYSPDGLKVAYTKAGYEGIWVFYIQTLETKQITDESSAGFGYKWSSDSKSILTRVAKYEEMKRMNTIKVFNIDSNESLQLTEHRTRMEYLPEWSDGDTKVILPTKESYEIYSSGKSKLLYKNNNQKNVLLKYDRIVSQDISNNEVLNINPFGDAEYIDLSLSPNRTKVLFKVVGGNMYVMNIDGTNLIDLGRGDQPSWSWGGNKIIYTIIEDDGHNFIASDIYLINADGTNKKNVTNTKDSIEMNPSLSPDNKTVVYDNYNDGSIYLMNIEEGE
jgi:Tol biopolymer transport system component